MCIAIFPRHNFAKCSDLTFFEPDITSGDHQPDFQSSQNLHDDQLVSVSDHQGANSDAQDEAYYTQEISPAQGKEYQGEMRTLQNLQLQNISVPIDTDQHQPEIYRDISPFNNSAIDSLTTFNAIKRLVVTNSMHPVNNENIINNDTMPNFNNGTSISPLMNMNPNNMHINMMDFHDMTSSMIHNNHFPHDLPLSMRGFQQPFERKEKEMLQFNNSMLMECPIPNVLGYSTVSEHSLEAVSYPISQKLDADDIFQRSKSKKRTTKKTLQRSSKSSSKSTYDNYISADFLANTYFMQCDFEVSVKPARRLNTEYASRFPSELCSKPYKYLIAVRSKRKSHFKFFLTIQEDKDSCMYTQLRQVEHSSTTGVHVQKIKQKEAANGDDIQYFYIKFLETSFKNSKRYFRLNVVSDDNRRYESDAVKLVARRSKKDNQDRFWSQNERPPGSGKNKKSRMDLEDDSNRITRRVDDELEDDPAPDDESFQDIDSPSDYYKRDFDEDDYPRKRRRL